MTCVSLDFRGIGEGERWSLLNINRFVPDNW